MDTILKVIVEKPQTAATFKEVYRNSIDVNNSIEIPYCQLVSTFKFLYGKDSVVHFQVY